MWTTSSWPGWPRRTRSGPRGTGADEPGHGGGRWRAAGAAASGHYRRAVARRSGGWAVGQDDARGLRLAGLVLPADRDAVTAVLLPQLRLELLRRRDALPVHRDDHVALGQAGAGRGRAGDDPGDDGTAAGLDAVGRGAVGRQDLHPQEPGRADVHRGGGGARLDLVGDRLGLVDGDSEGLRLLALELRPLRGRGVDADDLPGGVDERAARVTRLDTRVVMDEPGQLLRGARA